MSDNESFLARWSHRKHAAATSARDQPQPNKPIPETAGGSLSAGEDQALVDPKSLPPIETIDAGSDIRPFLAKGVPADLTRAALRRAWSADPVIRDFIGLSENSWDFNAPSGVPGFGALTVEDAHRLLTQVTEGTEALNSNRSAEPRTDDHAPAPVSESPKTTGHVAAQKLGPDSEADHESPVLRGSEGDTAAQHKRQECKPRQSVPLRRLGRALPE